MQLTVKVADGLNPDLKALALACLSGNESAAGPMVDCYLENTSGKRERLSVAYVDGLEDFLIWIRNKVRREEIYHYQELFNGKFFNLERTAHTLNRHGLS